MSQRVPAAHTQAHPRATYGLAVLSLINLVNYVDRYIVFSLILPIEAEFHINHTESGLLTMVFLIVYMVASPIGGWLGDRIPRRYLVAVSVFIWSLTTVGSGLAGSFAMLLLARGLTGIGEAGYGTVAPAVISDLYPRSRRSSVLAYFYLALPIGAAIAYGAGGWIAAHYSWRDAFFVVGLPGILLSLLALRLPEPVRGATEAEPISQETVAMGAALRALSRNAMFWILTTGYTLMTFAMGGLAAWMPTFLEKERGMEGPHADLMFGIATAVAGIGGTLLGGLMGDWADRRWKNGGLWVSGVALLIAAPLMVVAATLHGDSIFGVIFLAQLMLFFNTGPINAAICNCVPAGLRARAVGVNILIIHLFGDAISAVIIGAIAQHSNFQISIELNAIPIALGGVALCVAGSRPKLSAGPMPAALAA